MPSPGFEPGFAAPQATVLSARLRGLVFYLFLEIPDPFGQISQPKEYHKDERQIHILIELHTNTRHRELFKYDGDIKVFQMEVVCLRSL